MASAAARWGPPLYRTRVSPHDLVNWFVLSNEEVAELVLQILGRPSVLGGSSSSTLRISNSLTIGKAIPAPIVSC